MKRHPNLVVTGLAFLFLLLDGLLLCWVGTAFHSVTLLALGAAFLGSCVLVVLAYRRYLRNLEELRIAQRMLKIEMDRLMESVREGGSEPGVSSFPGS